MTIDDFATVVQLARIGFDESEILSLFGSARELRGIAEWECTHGELSERRQRRREKARRHIKEICLRHGIEVRFTNDPRGHVVVVELPSGRSNRAGDDGWGIV
jgi:hypothetical protein